MGLAGERRDASPIHLSGALPVRLRDPVTDPASLLASPVAAFAVPSIDEKGRGATPTSGRSGHSLDLESITHSFGSVKVVAWCCCPSTSGSSTMLFNWPFAAAVSIVLLLSVLMVVVVLNALGRRSRAYAHV